MKTMNDVMLKYSAGEIALDEANMHLKEMNTGIYLDAEKHILTEADKRATTIGYYIDQTNGWGLLDTGTGTLDKVQVRDGKLVDCDCGDMYALLWIAGRTYEVKGAQLVEVL